MKKTGTSFQDLDILGDIWEDVISSGWGIDDVNILDGIDFWNKEDAESSTDTSTADVNTELSDTSATPDKPTEDATAPTVEGEKETNDNKWTDEELDDFINQLLASQWELEDKAQEVKDAAENSDDPQLIKLVDELQTMLAEKNIEIEELKKTNEVTLNKYLNKYWEDSDMSLYKPEVDMLESNPKLRALVKFRGSDNDKIKTKVDNIVMDLIYDRLWIDVSELLEKKDKDNVSSVLNTPSSDAPLMPELKEEEDKELNYEQSTNDIF